MTRAHLAGGALTAPSLLPSVVAALVFLLVNNGLVGVAIALRMRVRLWRVLAADARWQLMTSTPLLGLGPLAAQSVLWTPAAIVLLLIPIVVPLIVPLYNATDPTIAGWPRFYWLQLLFVALGVATTVLVYRMTRRSKTEQTAARDAIARDADAKHGER